MSSATRVHMFRARADSRLQLPPAASLHFPPIVQVAWAMSAIWGAARCHHHRRVPKQQPAMSSAVVRSTPTVTLPPTQNTAPVLEFRCLYTHDVRRKSKRWQDGFLKYHTFNRRVMVYDASRNFIGDMHWRESGHLQDGEELTLERSGALVQVGEAVGTSETDLTPLFQRRSNEVPERILGHETITSPALTTRGTAALTPSQSRHKPLNAVLGTPRGPYGKATLPIKSPYEARHAPNENTRVEGRAAKRQRVDRASLAQSCSSTGTMNKTTRIVRETPLWTRAVDACDAQVDPDLATGVRAALAPSGGLPAKGVVEISSDTEDLPADATLPSNPVAELKPIPPTSRVSGAREPVVPSSPPTSAVDLQEKHRPSQAETRRRKEITHQRLSGSLFKAPPAKLLRPAAAAPRKMLLCLESSGSRPTIGVERQRVRNPPSETPSGGSDASSQLSRKPRKPVSETPRSGSLVLQRDRATTQMARSKRHKPLSSPLLDTDDTTTDTVAPPSLPRLEQHSVILKPSSQCAPSPAIGSRILVVAPDIAVAASEEMAQAHGRMDQQLLSPKATSKIPDLESQTLPPLILRSANRPFRRVCSENDTPGLGGCDPMEASETVNEGLGAVFSRLTSKGKKVQASKSQFQRSRSLSGVSVHLVPLSATTGATGTSHPEIFGSTNDVDMGPWSTEAFDLFDWRPPDRDADGNKTYKHDEADAATFCLD